MTDVTFQESPLITIGKSTFKNVPVVIQYEETPPVEVSQFETAGFTTRFTIYHPDGTKIA
jgi:hypothetical protein